jgi:hypothetical protein
MLNQNYLFSGSGFYGSLFSYLTWGLCGSIATYQKQIACAIEYMKMLGKHAYTAAGQNLEK